MAAVNTGGYKPLLNAIANNPNTVGNGAALVGENMNVFKVISNKGTRTKFDVQRMSSQQNGLQSNFVLDRNLTVKEWPANWQFAYSGFIVDTSQRTALGYYPWVSTSTVRRSQRKYLTADKNEFQKFIFRYVQIYNNRLKLIKGQTTLKKTPDEKAYQMIQRIHNEAKRQPVPIPGGVDVNGAVPVLRLRDNAAVRKAYSYNFNIMLKRAIWNGLLLGTVSAYATGDGSGSDVNNQASLARLLLNRNFEIIPSVYSGPAKAERQTELAYLYDAFTRIAQTTVATARPLDGIVDGPELKVGFDNLIDNQAGVAANQRMVPTAILNQLIFPSIDPQFINNIQAFVANIPAQTIAINELQAAL